MSERLVNNKVAARYARALFDSVADTKDAEAVRQDLDTLSQVFEQVPQLVVFLENPGIPVQDKLDLVEKQLSKGVNPWVARLMRIMVENGRMQVFPQLVVNFTELWNQRENTARAEVVTAVELEAELKARIQRTLESTLGFNRVDVQNRVDPGILGGMIVKIQDRIIDGSYIGRLEDLRKQLVKV
jgi:F-type H+-transporting ATPase subunit delta